ncbi:hypothetical protein AQPE_3318 [Aquipluma nitroreducens]|uniref:Uncharacterized protein n=1 Tax=Aquipluma nitroreducens TaxID=2010828 RepID=A0A5K7SD03_9BACT|nr:hypothetical protein AQPE_3318 [Aquipluma nitroreducens]
MKFDSSYKQNVALSTDILFRKKTESSATFQKLLLSHLSNI